MLADLEDLDDMRVLQAGDGFGFGAEACQLVGLGVFAGQNHLEGDKAIGVDLSRRISLAHSISA
jgi:hypothetical protein